MPERHRRVEDYEVVELRQRWYHDLGKGGEHQERRLYDWHSFGEVAIDALEAERQYTRQLEHLLLAERANALGLTTPEPITAKFNPEPPSAALSH
jgi:hypothetical protein